MAFDWTKLEGYREDMTAEEKIALMDSYTEPAAPDTSKLIAKTQFDKVASELAEAKKQLRSRMTADEQAEEARKTAEAEMKAELEELRRDKKLSNYRASYLAQGYDEELASLAATAMLEDDTEALFAVMKKHSANMEKALRAQILKDTPTPPAGDEANEEQVRALKEYNQQRFYAGLPPVTKLPNNRR